MEGERKAFFPPPSSPQNLTSFSHTKSGTKKSSKISELFQGIDTIHDEGASTSQCSSIQSSKPEDGNLTHSSHSLISPSEKNVATPSSRGSQDHVPISASPSAYVGHALAHSESVFPLLQPTSNRSWTKNIHPSQDGGNAARSGYTEALISPSSGSAPPTPLMRENTSATYGSHLLGSAEVFSPPLRFQDSARNAYPTASTVETLSHGSSSPVDRRKKEHEPVLVHETSRISAVDTSKNVSRSGAQGEKDEVSDSTDTAFPLSSRLPSHMVVHGLRPSDAKEEEKKERKNNGIPLSAGHWEKKDPHGDSFSPLQRALVEGRAEGVTEERFLEMDAFSLDWHQRQKSPSQPILSARKPSITRFQERRGGGGGDSDEGIDFQKRKPVGNEKEKYKHSLDSGRKEKDRKPEGKCVGSVLTGKIEVTTPEVRDDAHVRILRLPLSSSLPNTNSIESSEEHVRKKENDSICLAKEDEKKETHRGVEGAGKSESSLCCSALQEERRLPAALPITQSTTTRKKIKKISSTKYSSSMGRIDGALSSFSSLRTYQFSSTTPSLSPEGNPIKGKRSIRSLRRNERVVKGEFSRERRQYWIQSFPWIIRFLIAVVVIGLAHFCVTLLVFYALNFFGEF